MVRCCDAQKMLKSYSKVTQKLLKSYEPFVVMMFYLLLFNKESVVC